MDKEIFLKIAQFYKDNLREPIREAFKKAVKACIKLFWEYIKEYVIDSARKSIAFIEAFLSSDAGEAKKQAVVELIMSKLKLPLPLRPFKFLIKKILKDKIDEVVNGALDKVKELEFLA